MKPQWEGEKDTEQVNESKGILYSRRVSKKNKIKEGMYLKTGQFPRLFVGIQCAACNNSLRKISIFHLISLF